MTERSLSILDYPSGLSIMHITIGQKKFKLSFADTLNKFVDAEGDNIEIKQYKCIMGTLVNKLFIGNCMITFHIYDEPNYKLDHIPKHLFLHINEDITDPYIECNPEAGIYYTLEIDRDTHKLYRTRDIEHLDYKFSHRRFSSMKSAAKS